MLGRGEGPSSIDKAAIAPLNLAPHDHVAATVEMSSQLICPPHRTLIAASWVPQLLRDEIQKCGGLFKWASQYEGVQRAMRKGQKSLINVSGGHQPDDM